MSPLRIYSADDITIGLVMPEEELNGIKPDAFKLLKAKLEKMLTSAGVSSYGGDFVLYPEINIVDERIVEGGIKNFFQVDIDLSLNVVNPGTNTLFASETWTLKGTAERVKANALKNAISNLKGDSQFKSFIQKTKEKIYSYYESNKNNILTNASSLANSGNYEEAIGILSSYPSQVNGYQEAQTLLHQIYKKYVNVNASKILNEARAAYAVKNYSLAVELASQIDSESSMYNEAKTIINQVRSTVNNEQAAEKQRAMRALEIAADVEKNRQNAIASVARAYYGRKVTNYNVIRVVRR